MCLYSLSDNLQRKYSDFFKKINKKMIFFATASQF